MQREEVKRTLCLMLSGDLSMPLQCRFVLGHRGGHDWEIEKNPLTDFRVKQLREEDSPSGLLPVRVPGAALRDAEESSGATDAGDAAGGSDREADLDRVTAAMGITLLPWQRQYLLAVMNGESVVMSRGRRMGWTTVQNVARELQKERRWTA